VLETLASFAPLRERLFRFCFQPSDACRSRDNVSMRDRLLKVLKKVTTEPLNIGDEDSLFESGLLDSFALPDLVSGLEEEFSFKVPDADLNPRKFDSIARIEAYLSEHAKV
jgi:acyl carrier protein